MIIKLASLYYYIKSDSDHLHGVCVNRVRKPIMYVYRCQCPNFP